MLLVIIGRRLGGRAPMKSMIAPSASDSPGDGITRLTNRGEILAFWINLYKALTFWALGEAE
jgi:hypothetical protein